MSEGLRDYYAVLGVARTASAGEIWRSYCRLALAHHPDRAGIARRDPSGVIELVLTQPEATRGGVALIDLPLPVRCQTCGGIARPGGFWCLRCAQTGVGVSPVTVVCAIDGGVRDGEVIQIATTEAGGFEPVQLRIKLTQQP
jgi:DnaJ-class molecular chaperone